MCYEYTAVACVRSAARARVLPTDAASTCIKQTSAFSRAMLKLCTWACYAKPIPWLATIPAVEQTLPAACTVMDKLFPLGSAKEFQLERNMNRRSWRPQTQDGDDPTRFYPSTNEIRRDLYTVRPPDESPYNGYEPFNATEKQRVEATYVSWAQKTAHIIHKLVRTRLDGHPPRLVVEVGSFIGSGAIHVWGKLASQQSASREERMSVICVDTWQGALLMKLGSLGSIFKMKKGAPTIQELFMRRVLTNGLQDTIFPLAHPGIGGAKLLYLLGYRVDVVYVDSAHEMGETLIELHLYYQLLRPGGLMMGDDLLWIAVQHDLDTFCACHNVTAERFGTNQWLVKKPLRSNTATDSNSK